MCSVLQRSAWARYEPSEETSWNLRRVVHLHRRAGFAAPWEILQRDLRDGPQAAVSRLLAGELPLQGTRDEFEALAGTIGDAAAASSNPERLKAWWIYRMLATPDPLGERLTLMWHNHFATSNRKVQDLALMREQNELLRRYGQGEFGRLLEAVIKHPAMLLWLDADSNRRGRPNENLARELMELFTLGIGHYSEHDVQEAARALTGWGMKDKAFHVLVSRHDAAEKLVLGVRGRLDGDDLLQLLLERPATAERIARRICATFLADGVADRDSVAELATELRARRLDIAGALEAVLRSERFFCNENVQSRIAGPVEYVVGALRSLELCRPPPSTLTLAEWLARMGQDLFYPPNVGGWKEGRSWLASRTMVARANFAAALVEGQLWRPEQVPDLAALARKHAGISSWEEALRWYAQLLGGEAEEPSLEEVIKAAAQSRGRSPLAIGVALLLAGPVYQLS